MKDKLLWLFISGAILALTGAINDVQNLKAETKELKKVVPVSIKNNKMICALAIVVIPEEDREGLKEFCIN